jgi:hypothetical protein
LISLKKLKIYIIILSVAGLIFSILNPSIDIAILVPFFWYIYVWEKKHKKEKIFKYYPVFKYAGLSAALIVVVRVLIYNL